MHSASRVETLAVGYAAKTNIADGWRLGSMMLFLVMLLLVLTTFRDYGISWDENVQKEYGEHILAYYEIGICRSNGGDAGR